MSKNDFIGKTAGIVFNAAIKQLARNTVNSAYYNNNETVFEQAYERQQAKKDYLYTKSIVSTEFQQDFIYAYAKGKPVDPNVYVDATGIYNEVYDLNKAYWESKKILPVSNETFQYTVAFCNKNYIKGTGENSFMIPVDHKIRDRRHKSGYRIDTDLEMYTLISENSFNEIIERRKKELAERKQQEEEEALRSDRRLKIFLAILIAVLSIIIGGILINEYTQYGEISLVHLGSKAMYACCEAFDTSIKLY